MDIIRLWMLSFASVLAIKNHPALNIRECSSGMKSVTEDSNVSLTCGPYDYRIQWFFTRDFRQTEFISECHDSTCYPIVNNQFSIHAQRTLWTMRTSLYESRLDIWNITRQEAFFFYCYETNSEKRASCRLQIAENEKSSAANVTGGIIGGVVAAVVVIAGIGTIIAVFIVKRQRGKRG